MAINIVSLSSPTVPPILLLLGKKARGCTHTLWMVSRHFVSCTDFPAADFTLNSLDLDRLLCFTIVSNL